MTGPGFTPPSQAGQQAAQQAAKAAADNAAAQALGRAAMDNASRAGHNLRQAPIYSGRGPLSRLFAFVMSLAVLAVVVVIAMVILQQVSPGVVDDVLSRLDGLFA